MFLTCFSDSISGDEMAVHAEDIEMAKQRNALWSEETVMVTATQKTVAPGGSFLTPATVLATDKRIIIINRPLLGIRNEYEAIPYDRIASIRYERGVITSSIFLMLTGNTTLAEHSFLKQGEQEGEIKGLGHEDAKALSDFIQKLVIGLKPKNVDLAPDQTPKVHDIEAQTKAEAKIAEDASPQAKTITKEGLLNTTDVYCGMCGAKNNIKMKFCTRCGAPMAIK